MSLLDRLAFFANKEAKAVVAALYQLSSLFEKDIYGHAAYEQIKKTVEDSVKKNHRRVRHEVLVGRAPKEICLGAMATAAFEDIYCGRDHIYRGVLSGIGAGKKLVWEIAMQELLKSGFTTQDIYDARQKELDLAIREVG